MSTTRTLLWSDIDLQDPGSYYQGFKEARVKHFGDGERSLSNMRDGTVRGSTFSMVVSDFDRSIREAFNSETLRYWNGPVTIRMVDRPTRAALGRPYTVWNGPIINMVPVAGADMGPSTPLLWDFTLGDIISRVLLHEDDRDADQGKVPWRRIGDGFLSQFEQVADGLDPNTPEPIIYGIHNRLPTDAAFGSGLVYPPVYLGILSVASVDTHVWLIAGHACADVPDVYVDYVVSGDFDVQNGVDFRSDTYGNDRRYTLLYAAVTDPTFLDPEATAPAPEDVTDPDACARGQKKLHVTVQGIEPVGDGTGPVITDRLDQYKHFAINFLANQAQSSYQSGAWLTTPTWDLFDATVPIIDENSFDDAQAISLIRFPGDGYTGAGVIGARASDRKSIADWIAAWNISCSVRSGFSHFGQFRIFMLHPTQAIKDAAPLLEETNDILEGSFLPWIRLEEQANRIPLLYDPTHDTGEFVGVSAVTDGISVDGYRRTITGDTRIYPFCPGIVNAEHIATIELRVTRFPPRGATFQTALTPLGMLDLGQYIRYRHYASIGASASEIRLGWIERHQVQSGKRLVEADILDVDDLIDFDHEAEGSVVSPLNDTCANAIDITGDLDYIVADDQYHYRETYDTTDHATDPSVADIVSVLLPDPHVGYHAWWAQVTSPIDGNFAFSTITSNYDTRLFLLTGTCGSSPMDWTVENFNDNQVINGTEILTSAANIDLTAGQTIYILVVGFGPDDGGTLEMSGSLVPPA